MQLARSGISPRDPFQKKGFDSGGAVMPGACICGAGENSRLARIASICYLITNTATALGLVRSSVASNGNGGLGTGLLA
jgi:hypothetical protein